MAPEQDDDRVQSDKDRGLLKTLTLQELGTILLILSACAGVPIFVYESGRMPALREQRELALANQVEAEQTLNQFQLAYNSLEQEKNQLEHEVERLGKVIQENTITPNPFIPESTTNNQFDRSNLYYNSYQDFVGLNLFVSNEYRESLENPEEIEVHIIFSEGTRAVNFCINDADTNQNCSWLNPQTGEVVSGSNLDERSYRMPITQHFPDVDLLRVTHFTFDIPDGFRDGRGGFAVTHIEIE